jgi:hypothetical protein
MSKRNEKGRLRPFVPLDVEVMSSPAWRATSHGARWLYVHLKRRWSFKQRNNGRLFLSHRDAIKEIGCPQRDSIGRWFRELQHYGFVVQTEAGCLGVDGKGKAPRWRLTELEAYGGRNGGTWMLPTKDYLKWDGTKFRDDRGAVLRARKKKQNPVLQSKARVSCKEGTGLSCKSRPVDGTTVLQMQAISDTPPVLQSQDRSRSTTRVARGRGDLKGRSPEPEGQQGLLPLLVALNRKGPQC